jgi:hypothetical protein
MRTVFAGLDQVIKRVRIRQLVSLQNHQFATAGDYRRPALEGLVGELAQMALGRA